MSISSFFHNLLHGSPTLTAIQGEVPVGTIDGINTKFTLRNIPDPDTIAVYFNGLRIPNNAYVLLNSTLTLKTAPNGPTKDNDMMGDSVLVDYFKVN